MVGGLGGGGLEYRKMMLRTEKRNDGNFITLGCFYIYLSGHLIPYHSNKPSICFPKSLHMGILKQLSKLCGNLKIISWSKFS